MTAITLKLPARYATVRPGPLGGVEVLIDHLTLSSLADALNAMEHNDTDPGERPMNADQCRDALLRELLGGWSPSELVEAKIPGVLQMADEIATLRRERDEARASKVSGMLLETFDKRSSSYEELAEKINSWLYADRKPSTPTPGAQP